MLTSKLYIKLHNLYIYTVSVCVFTLHVYACLCGYMKTKTQIRGLKKDRENEQVCLCSTIIDFVEKGKQ